ncbi:unnamed protein product [Debaryomyces tyrocola]|nr:unnamed protein product [Debaryomyces tyrocola]
MTNICIRSALNDSRLTSECTIPQTSAVLQTIVFRTAGPHPTRTLTPWNKNAWKTIDEDDRARDEEYDHKNGRRNKVEMNAN